MSVNLYAVLGVNAGSTANDIKDAYRRIALKTHPDKNTSVEAARVFQAASEAYQVLSNSQLRSQYDELRSGSGSADQQRRRRELFKKAYKPMNPTELFKHVVGSVRDLQQQRANEGLTKHKKMDMLFEVTPQLGVPCTYQWMRKRLCELCEGGFEIPCSRCKGGIRSVSGQPRTCNTCKGTGHSPINDCPTCKHRGYIDEKRQTTLTVTEEMLGRRTRLHGEGDEVLRNGFGDVIFQWIRGAKHGEKTEEEAVLADSDESLKPMPAALPSDEYSSAETAASGMGETEEELLKSPKHSLEPVPFSLSASSPHLAAAVGSKRSPQNVIRKVVPLSLKEALCGGVYFPIQVTDTQMMVIETEPGEVIQPGELRTRAGEGPNGEDVELEFRVHLPTDLTEADRKTLMTVLPTGERKYKDKASKANTAFEGSSIVTFIRDRRKESHHSDDGSGDALLRSI